MVLKRDVGSIARNRNQNIMTQSNQIGKNGLRVLIVDDEEDICELIRTPLEEEGFSVIVSHNGIDAWKKLETRPPDLVLLDLMLPGINGIDFCKKLKEKYDIPVIVITARTGETDAVLSLEMGADDYIRKPFHLRELIARVRAKLRIRMAGSNIKNSVLQVGKIRLDPSAHRVTIDGIPIELTLIEFNLLRLFLENPDMAFTRNHLLDRVWGNDVYVNDRTVDVNIKRLREKLGSEKERLETVRGIGYRLTTDPAES